MAWLFERTVEVAAWVAMAAAWVAAAVTVYGLVVFFRTWQADSINLGLLADTGRAAGACVAFAVGLGALACVDRFIYDADKT
ncbi:MAG: hypothetical protein AB7G28_00770 [Pirellulales bacterium]